MSIINASPTVVDLGRSDKALRRLPPETVDRPTHLPKFWIFSKKGPDSVEYVTFSSAKLMYGSDSFDPLKKWYNHATHFLSGILGTGNRCLVQRLVPSDASTSSLVLWCEIKTGETIPLYQRDPNTGKYIKDALGNPIPVSPPQTVTGNKIRWYIATNPNPDTNFGGLSVTAGSGIPGSTAYPILEFKASSKGAFGNNAGVAVVPASQDTVDKDFVSAAGSFPYLFYFTNNESGNNEIVENNYGEAYTISTLTKTSNPTTTQNLYIEDILIDSYQNTSDKRFPISYSDIGDVYLYKSNFNTISSAIKQAEDTAVVGLSSPIYDSSWYDNASSTEEYNIFNAISLKQAPYIATVVDNTISNSFIFNKNYPAYLSGGSDGTLSDSNFNALVTSKAREYLDPNSRVQDPFVNMESIFYDSGFPLSVKQELLNVIAVRKDTFVVLSTYTVGNPPNSVSDDMAVGTALLSIANTFPDSEEFGTGVFRAMIVMQSAITNNSIYNKRIPASYSIAIKSAKLMGSSNRIWKESEMFGMAPGNIVTEQYNIQPEFVPQPTQLLLWDKNIVWILPYDRNRYFFPTQQTVYDDDTSVLNSYISSMIVIEADKVGWEAWRAFTGVSSMTDKQLASAIKNYVEFRLKNVFDKFVDIEPVVSFN